MFKTCMHSLRLALQGILFLSGILSCTKTATVVGEHPYSSSVFVATDRHEAGDGNNLQAMLQMVVSNLQVVTPQTILLGGDYVGAGPDLGEGGQPEFSAGDVLEEVNRAMGGLSYECLMTYGSHDRNCLDGYEAFFSGPHRADGYYVYGISHAQMAFDTDSAALSAVADTLRPYNGIDLPADRYGISAESASKSFLAWAAMLSDHAPIVMMSHVPMHALRNDNRGGYKWFQAIREVASGHPVILLFGHNHTTEERGDPSDAYVYFLAPGESIQVQGGTDEGVVDETLNFAYANAGYLKLGWSSVITFTDYDRNGLYDSMSYRRFSMKGEDDTEIGLTGKLNPYTIYYGSSFAR